MSLIQLKVCSKCEEAKDFSLFYNSKSSKDGVSVHCKACNYAYSRTTKGKERHRDAMRVYMKNRRDTDPEFRKANNKYQREYTQRKRDEQKNKSKLGDDAYD